MKNLIIIVSSIIFFSLYSKGQEMKVINVSQAGLYPGSHCSSNYVVEDTDGELYLVISKYVNNDVYYTKSTDYGYTWSEATLIHTTTNYNNISVWYDRWSQLNSDTLRIFWNNGVDLFYSELNLSNDNLGSVITVLDSTGGSSGNYGGIGIINSRSGNILLAQGWTQNSGAGIFGKISTNGGATWSSANVLYESGTSGFDKFGLLPGYDNSDDFIAIYLDQSAGEISKKIYDYSAGTWSETSIATGLTISANSGLALGLATDTVNNQNLVSFLSGPTSTTGDLLFWKFSESSTTQLTDVITNIGTASCITNFSRISIDNNTNYWYVSYGGRAGTNNNPNVDGIRYKYSTNGGSTWSSEQTYTDLLIYKTETFTPMMFGNYTDYFIVSSGSAGNLIYKKVHIKKVNGVDAW